MDITHPHHKDKLENSTDIEYENYSIENNRTQTENPNTNDYQTGIGFYILITIIVFIIFALLTILFITTIYQPYKKLKKEEQQKKEDDFRHKTIIALLPPPAV